MNLLAMEVDDLEKFIQVEEAYYFHDTSIITLLGVQLLLWGGSVLKLGTEGHHQAYLEKLKTAEIRGCFALTGDFIYLLYFISFLF